MIPYWDQMLEFWHTHLNRSWKQSKVWYNNRFIYKTLDTEIIPFDLVMKIQKIFGCSEIKNMDERVLAIAKKVRKKFLWTSDEVVYNKLEYWEYYTRLAVKMTGSNIVKDDCDGISTAIAGTLILCGIPRIRVRINAGYFYPGDGTKFGHAWVTYLPTGQVNRWRIIESSADPGWFDARYNTLWVDTDNRHSTPWWMFTQGLSWSKRTIKMDSKNFLREVQEVNL